MFNRNLREKVPITISSIAVNTVLESSTYDCNIPEEGTVHDSTFELPDNSKVLIINNFLSEEDLNDYLSKTCTVVRHRDRSTMQFGPNQYTTVYSPDGTSLKRGPITYYSDKYPDHTLNLVQKIQDVVEHEYSNSVQLDAGVDIYYPRSVYLDGYIDRHSDNGQNWCAVAIYSLGQTRYLRVKGTDYYNVKLTHNSLVVMLDSIDSEPGQFQRLYTHQIDKLNTGQIQGDRLSLNVRFLRRNY